MANECFVPMPEERVLHTGGDRCGQLCVVDDKTVVRWVRGAAEGLVVARGVLPRAIAFDRHGRMHVGDDGFDGSVKRYPAWGPDPVPVHGPHLLEAEPDRIRTPATHSRCNKKW